MGARSDAAAIATWPRCSKPPALSDLLARGTGELVGIVGIDGGRGADRDTVRVAAHIGPRGEN
jgi:hypothetical protein